MQRIQHMKIHNLSGNQQLSDALSNLRQGDAVVLDVDSLLLHQDDSKSGKKAFHNKDLPKLMRHLKETGHPVILLTAHEDKSSDEIAAKLTKMGVKDDAYTLLHAPKDTGEILIEHIKNNTSKFKDIKRLHIVNGNSEQLENIENALSKDDVCKNIGRLHYHYQQMPPAPAAALSQTEEGIIARSIVKTQLKKGKVLDDIKHKRHPLLFSERASEIQKESNQGESAGFSQSEFYLKSVMGDDFNDEASIATNIKTFLESKKYKDYSNPYEGGYLEEPEFEYSEADKKKLIPQSVNMIEYEKTHPEMVFFYHGASGQIAYAYKIYTALYKILAADSALDALRADNALFHRCLNIQAFIAHFQSFSDDRKINDHDTRYIEGAISANLFLFGNYDKLGENTIHFYINNRTVSSINLKVMLEASLKSMGVDDSAIKQLTSLFNEFPQRNQGVIYQIGLPKDEVDRYAYLAGALGVPNPLSKAAGGTTDVSRLLAAIHSGEELQSDYIKNVQARVMIPPEAPISVNQYNWGEQVDPNKQAVFDKRLDELAQEMAYDILLHRTQFNKLNSKSALMRYLPDVMQQAGIDLDKNNITDDVVIHLVEVSDFESIKTIVEAYPEYKEKPLISTKKEAYSSYTNQKGVDENAPRTLLERCLAIRHAGEGIRAIYGNHFYEGKLNTLPFHQVVGALPDGERLGFIMKHQDRVQHVDLLALILDVVNKYDQAKLIEFFHDKIQNVSQVVKISIMLSEEIKSAFAKRHTDKIRSISDFQMVINALPEDARLDFAMANRDKIQRSYEVGMIIKSLPKEAQWDFAMANGDKIHSLFDVVVITGSLHVNTKFDFAMVNRNKIQNDFDLKILTKELPQNVRFDFAMANSDKIGNSLGDVLSLLHEDQRFEFLIKNADKIRDDSQLESIIKNLPMYRVSDIIPFININLAGPQRDKAINMAAQRDQLDGARGLSKLPLLTQIILSKAPNAIRTLELILQHPNINVNLIDALHVAITHNNIDAVKALLKNKAIDINAGNALAIAIKADRLDIVKILLNHPAINVNQLDNEGVLPIGLAMHKMQETGRDDVVKALLDHQKINPELPLKFSDNASRNQYTMEPLITFLTKSITKVSETGGNPALKDGLERCLNELKEDMIRNDNILDPKNSLSQLSVLVASANTPQNETLFPSVPILDILECKKSMDETQKRYISVVSTVRFDPGK